MNVVRSQLARYGVSALDEICGVEEDDEEMQNLKDNEEPAYLEAFSSVCVEGAVFGLPDTCSLACCAPGRHGCCKRQALPAVLKHIH